MVLAPARRHHEEKFNQQETTCVPFPSIPRSDTLFVAVI